MRATLLKEGNCACALRRCTRGKKHIIQTFFGIKEYHVLWFQFLSIPFTKFCASAKTFSHVRLQRPLLSTPDSAKGWGVFLGYHSSSCYLSRSNMNMYMLCLLTCGTRHPVGFNKKVTPLIGLILTAYLKPLVRLSFLKRVAHKIVVSLLNIFMLAGSNLVTYYDKKKIMLILPVSRWRAATSLLFFSSVFMQYPCTAYFLYLNFIIINVYILQ